MKFRKSALGLFALTLLASCGSGNDYLIVMQASSENSYITHINKGKDDNTVCSFFTVAFLDLNDKPAFDIVPNDFSVKDNNNEYKATSFIVESYYSSMIVNGEKQTAYYIVKTKDSHTITSDDSQVQVSFETELSDAAILSFRGKAI